MNLERIEPALREGPIDEPRYVPGAFGATRRLESVFLAAAVVGAVALGVVIGLGLDVVTAPTPDVGGPPTDPAVIQRQLAGTWLSEPVTQDQFIDFMLEQGHSQADIEVWLDHDPIATTIRWGLDFDGRGSLVVFSVTGDGVTDVLSNGPYELLPEGRLRWFDLTCTLHAEFSVSADALVFGPLALENCDPIAMDTFFNLASPYRSSVR